jgi:hypothetical protein
MLTLLSMPAKAQTQAQTQAVDGSFYSLNFLKGILGTGTKNLSKSKDSSSLHTIYTLLYDLRNQRLIFTDALQNYVKAVESNASTLEVDFRLNDVGEAAAAVIADLAHMNLEYQKLGAQLSIANPDVDKLIRNYYNRNDRLVGAQILSAHRMNTRDLKTLHDIASAAQENGELLNQALDQLRLAILAEHPEYLRQ